MVEIQFAVSGEKQLSRNLRVLAKNLSKMEDFFDSALDIMEDRTNEIFKSEWSTVQKWNKWTGLAPSTKKARARRWWYYKKPPSKPWLMRWTWRLQESLTKETRSSYWLLYFEAPYAKFHHRWWKWNLPRRSLIDLDNRTNVMIVKSLQQKIEDDIWIFRNQS